MTHSSNPIAQMWLDFEALPVEAIDLSPVAIDEAVRLIADMPNEQRQWQTYLNALALFGFEQWLAERDAQIAIDRQHCSLFDPQMNNVIEAVCHLKVNQFKLCLITTGSLADEEVTLPRAVVDLPEFAHHFYVLVEVQEEQEIAVVRGFLSYNQLMERQARANIQADDDWTYQFPSAWFEQTPDRLLLNLRCLDNSAIPLPAVPNHRLTQLSRMRSQLETLLPQLDSPNRQLWEVLTWEQGTAILTSRELVNWLYQLQTQESPGLSANLTNYLSDLLRLLTQQAMNVGRWLWDELDELAQELSWQLLPSVAPVAAFRSPKEEFESIVRSLQHKSIDISPQARGAYRNLHLAGIPLRLYALTWPLLSDSIPEWTLLLILGTPSETPLPPGLKLRISDQTGILVEQAMDRGEQNSYFFTSVVGTWDEKFLATVSLAGGIEETLPPFSFALERVR
ncbi:MAG TPA: hypothetical protein DDZ80_17615 [Cyanobacteria bacterium UBA8803]|nr:hypothetical protein [Cyanobacteria bacterium UBA9273]HBL60206.1 hypothetical protein [Cyanobacteria bacterium UBA8803]